MAALSSKLSKVRTVGVDGSSLISVKQVEGGFVCEKISLSDSWPNIASQVERFWSGSSSSIFGSCGGGGCHDCGFLHLIFRS